MAKPIQLQMPGRPATPPPDQPPPAGLDVLFAAPHRPMFLAGAIQTVLTFVPWVWELLARSGALAGPAWPWPPGWVHGLWAIYGVFPFFVFGFLMTAMPRWQGMADTPGTAARRPWPCLVAGWLLFDARLERHREQEARRQRPAGQRQREAHGEQARPRPDQPGITQQPAGQQA